jgi:anaerobic selenocysteine-containing dehydrogenase
MCGLEIEHQDGAVVAIRGDKQDPLSQGHICPKAVALKDLHEDPDRLRQPMRRTDNGWEPISWEEALDETARRLRETRETHGKNAVAAYIGNPTVHNHGALLFLIPFLRALGTRNRYSATSADQLPQMLACLQMFGHQAAFPVPDIDRTDYFLVIGANPMASNGSVMTAPDMRGRLKKLRARGGRLVVIDPRRTETAAVADEHLFIRPGTDAYLMLAMVHVLFRDTRIDMGHLDGMVTGTEQLAEAVAPWTPDRVADITGIDAATIERLAHEFAAAPSAAAYCRVGTSTAPFSSIATALVYALNIITGNLDRPGGLMFTQPAMDVVGLGAMSGDTGSFDRYRSRVRDLPEFGGEFPVTTLADEILAPGDGQVRAVVTHAGNPVLSTPDGKRLDKALAGLDFMVSIDLYINETTRHADIILPPTGHLEHAQCDPAFHALAVRNTIKFSPALFEPAPDAMHDWEILLGLIYRLNGGDSQPAGGRLVHRLLKRLGDRGMVDLLLRLGPYGKRPAWLETPRNWLARLPGGGAIERRLARLPLVKAMASYGPWASEQKPGRGLTLKKVIAEPHGIDLGPLQPMLARRIFTRDRRIQLMPEVYGKTLAAMENWQAPADGFLMIGRRHVRSNNSWMHNSQRLVKGKGRCDVMMHPDDAARLSLADGQTVSVISDTGQISLPLKVSEDIMPGVISVPHGWGHGREGVQLRVATRHAGASVNDVIGSATVETLTGMAVLNAVPVQVEAA